MKYRNRRTGGYDSKREAIRAQELKLLEKIGEIADLREQVVYELLPKQEGERAVKYLADFVYREGGRIVVEDVKSPITRTPAYVIKRKLMLYVHGIKLREVL